MEFNEKIEALREKLIDRIGKELDKETLKSKELCDYAYIINNLRSSEEYSKLIQKGLSGGFNGGFRLPSESSSKDEELD